MCEYCHSYPHLSGCPNEPPPPSIGTCACCTQDIIQEDEYADIDDKLYHLDCLEDMGIRDLLRMLDIDIRFADVD